MRRAKPKNVGEAMRLLVEHDAAVRCFYEDPMTQAMGVPTGDFQEDFNSNERELAAFILKHSPVDSRRWKYAMARMEKFMP